MVYKMNKKEEDEQFKRFVISQIVLGSILILFALWLHQY
jgi:hypothetical protein